MSAWSVLLLSPPSLSSLLKTEASSFLGTRVGGRGMVRFSARRPRFCRVHMRHTYWDVEDRPRHPLHSHTKKSSAKSQKAGKPVQESTMCCGFSWHYSKSSRFQICPHVTHIITIKRNRMFVAGMSLSNTCAKLIVINYVIMNCSHYSACAISKKPKRHLNQI